MAKPITGKPIGALAVEYMAKKMGMTAPLDDQEQNFLLGHLSTFATECLRRASRERKRTLLRRREEWRNSLRSSR